MARTVATLPAGSRISDYISLGVFLPLLAKVRIDEFAYLLWSIYYPVSYSVDSPKQLCTLS